MILEIRPVDLEKEYKIFLKWWKAHNWPGVARQVLSNFGYVVCDKETGRMLAAGWAYMDKYTPVAMIEWIVSNPDNTPRESLKSLNVLIDSMTESFKKTGYLAVLTSTKTPGLIRCFEKNGYLKSDSEMTHLVKILQTEA